MSGPASGRRKNGAALAGRILLVLSPCLAAARCAGEDRAARWLKKLKDGEPSVRGKAAWELGELRDPRPDLGPQGQ